MPREGSTESESTQEDLEEDDEDLEDEEDCYVQVQDPAGNSGSEEGPDLEEPSTGYKKVPILTHPVLVCCSGARWGCLVPLCVCQVSACAVCIHRPLWLRRSIHSGAAQRPDSHRPRLPLSSGAG